MSKRIHIDPAWSFRDEAGNTIDPQLFPLLSEIFYHKKLTLAAKSAGMSYRHGWNLLNKWAKFFGTPLVQMTQGKGAELTALGEKLLWAEQRVTARFQPQMANLASELNMEIQKTMETLGPLLRIQASYGYAVALLPDLCRDIHLDLQYSTPLEALNALNREACDLAGLHLPRDVKMPNLLRRYKSMLDANEYKVIRFITRQQGLMIRPHCQLQIEGLADLTRPGVRFINRQKDSGTRALFDQLLRNLSISSADIAGYGNQEFTHSAVAAYVAANMADVGFGVSHAAHQFGLRFIPLCLEDYIFLCHQKSLNRAALKDFIELIQNAEFSKAVDGLAGYHVSFMGTVENLSDWLRA